MQTFRPSGRLFPTVPGFHTFCHTFRKTCLFLFASAFEFSAEQNRCPEDRAVGWLWGGLQGRKIRDMSKVQAFIDVPDIDPLNDSSRNIGLVCLIGIGRRPTICLKSSTSAKIAPLHRYNQPKCCIVGRFRYGMVLFECSSLSK